MRHRILEKKNFLIKNHLILVTAQVKIINYGTFYDFKNFMVETKSRPIIYNLKL